MSDNTTAGVGPNESDKSWVPAMCFIGAYIFVFIVMAFALFGAKVKAEADADIIKSPTQKLCARDEELAALKDMFDNGKLKVVDQSKINACVRELYTKLREQSTPGPAQWTALTTQVAKLKTEKAGQKKEIQQLKDEVVRKDEKLKDEKAAQKKEVQQLKEEVAQKDEKLHHFWGICFRFGMHLDTMKQSVDTAVSELPLETSQKHGLWASHQDGRTEPKATSTSG